jgi:hypothetical protein
MLQNPAPDHSFHRGRVRKSPLDRILHLLDLASADDPDLDELRAENDACEQTHGAALASLPGLGAN